MAVPRYHNHLKREVLWITEKDTLTHTYIFPRTILLSSICGHLESIKKSLLQHFTFKQFALLLTLVYKIHFGIQKRKYQKTIT